MGNSLTKISDQQIEDFCKKCRPLDILVFSGTDGVSRLIKTLQKEELGSGQVSHVEIVMTPEWCQKITEVKKYFEAYNHVEVIKPHPKYLLSWGSELSGKLNDGVADGETGGVTFGVQFRDLKELARAYADRPGANIGICRLINNPTEVLTDEVDREALKKKLSEAYDKYKNITYDYNILNLLASLYPELRGARDLLEKLLKPVVKKDTFMFCSEFAASLFIDLGIVEGKDINPENIVPQDFVGHDTGSDTLRKKICEDPIWLK